MAGVGPALQYPAVWRRPSVVTNAFEKLEIWQFNQTYNTFSTNRKNILKLFSLEPRSSAKMKMQEAFVIFRKKLQCQTKWEMLGSFICRSNPLAMKVFPCKEKSLVVSSQKLGVQRGKVGYKVINLDNSMHLGC